MVLALFPPITPPTPASPSTMGIVAQMFSDVTSSYASQGLSGLVLLSNVLIVLIFAIGLFVLLKEAIQYFYASKSKSDEKSIDKQGKQFDKILDIINQTVLDKMNDLHGDMRQFQEIKSNLLIMGDNIQRINNKLEEMNAQMMLPNLINQIKGDE